MLITNWVILAILAGLGSNVLAFFSRSFLKDNGDSTAWAWTYEALRLLIFTLFLPFDFKIQLNLHTLYLLLAIGVTEVLSVYPYMKMHKYSHLSISTILSRTRLIWIPILGFLFFQERLALQQYLGIGILFLGLSVVVAPHKMFIDKGAIYANLAAVMIAINTILQKQAVPFASTSVIMIFFSLPSVILFPIFMKNAKQRLITKNKQKLGFKLAAVLSNVWTSIFFLAALRVGEVSRVNAVYQGMLIVGVLAGIILLKERKDIFRKLLGTVITVIGVILLT